VRVGVITFHQVLNYGAVLQAYALCQTIKRMGHNVGLIDYRPDVITKPYRIGSRRPWIVVPQWFRRWRYASFSRRFLPLTDCVWRSTEELTKRRPEFDAFVCGSDQIWNARILGGFDEAFFLDFTREDARRIAYAGSFGGTPIPESLRDQAAQLFRRFAHLSVREDFAEKQIEKLTGRRPVRVLDPSLLLNAEDYIPLVNGSMTKRDCIVAYAVGKSETFPQLIAKVAHRLHLPIVSI
jgi:hypothetical protein